MHYGHVITAAVKVPTNSHSLESKPLLLIKKEFMKAQINDHHISSNTLHTWK